MHDLETKKTPAAIKAFGLARDVDYVAVSHGLREGLLQGAGRECGHKVTRRLGEPWG